MTNTKALSVIALSALLLTAGCGKDKPANVAKAGETAPAPDGTTDAGPVPPDEVAEDGSGGTDAVPDTTPVKNAVAAAQGGVRRPPGWAPAVAGGNGSGSAGARARAGLAKYVDLRPREREGGRSFLTEPAVRNAVAAVRDARVREFIRTYNGPDAPIARRSDGRIIAWGCEAHNCGFHNWAVAIRPDGSGAEVCYYHNADDPDGTSTWYLPAGRTAKRDGNCPDE